MKSYTLSDEGRKNIITWLDVIEPLLDALANGGTKEYNMTAKKKETGTMDNPAPIKTKPIENKAEIKNDAVNHPKWYGSKDDPYETIKVIEAWGLNFTLGNALKYISRAGKKDPSKTVEDLRKALFYIQYEIERLEGKRV